MIDFSRNHFELFGLPPQFRFDAASSTPPIATCSRACTRTVSRPATTRSGGLAMQASARVNEAYRALREPVLRAQYLLRLHGIDAVGETDTRLPFEFLERQLERRESAGDAFAAGDDRTLDALLASVRTEARDVAGPARAAPRRRTRVGRRARNGARTHVPGQARRGSRRDARGAGRAMSGPATRAAWVLLDAALAVAGCAGVPLQALPGLAAGDGLFKPRSGRIADATKKD